MSAERLAATRDRLSDHGQEHLLRFAGTLGEEELAALLDQIDGFDLAEVGRLHEQSKAPELTVDPATIGPAEAIPLVRNATHQNDAEAAHAAGLQALEDGRVAVVLVAGGQGTRLGFDQPKGMFPISPVRQATLFRLHAERLAYRSLQAGRTIPWFIMTSPTNDRTTRDFFEENDDFGLPAGSVRFFVQDVMPAVDAASGKILLAEPGRVAVSPNGHGGTLAALREAGHLDRMEADGIEVVYYFQVDNGFADIADPEFLGHHLNADAQVSAKAIRKEFATEKLGLFVEANGKTAVIEYSDLPDELAHQTDADGELVHWAGSIAIHAFDRAFLQRISDPAAGADGLPYHFARKAVPHVDESGAAVEPDQPNAVKFERFIFDTLPLAERTVIVETSRSEEYLPLKNADGDHSPASVRQAMDRRGRHWYRELHGAAPDAVCEAVPALSPDARNLTTARSSEELRVRVVQGS